jgi:hypothetical protein
LTTVLPPQPKTMLPLLFTTLGAFKPNLKTEIYHDTPVEKHCLKETGKPPRPFPGTHILICSWCPSFPPLTFGRQTHFQQSVSVPTQQTSFVPNKTCFITVTYIILLYPVSFHSVNSLINFDVSREWSRCKLLRVVMSGRTMDKNRTVTWCERRGLVGLWINILLFTGVSDEMWQDLRVANSLRTPANERYHRTEDSHLDWERQVPYYSKHSWLGRIKRKKITEISLTPALYNINYKLKKRRLGIFPLLASWNEFEGTRMEAPCHGLHYKSATYWWYKGSK